MKKERVFVILLLVIFSLFVFSAFADDTDVNDSVEEVVIDDEFAEEEVVSDDSVEVTDDGVFNLDKSYNWLYNNSMKTSKIGSLSMAILALNDKGYDVTKQITKLEGFKAANSDCWSAGNCNTIDTSYSLLVRKFTGQDFSEGVSWLNSSLKYANLPDKWQLVLSSKMDGVCKVGYENNLKSFEIVNNEFVGTSNKHYLTLSEIGVPNNKVLPVIQVDCSEGMPSGAELVVSLNYRKSEYENYLVSGGQMTSGSLVVPNACFSKNPSSNVCDFESSLISSWALAEMGFSVDSFGTYVYLELSLNENKNLDLAFLTRFLETSAYQGISNLKTGYFENSLINSQGSDGSWDNLVYSSSVATFALVTSSYSSEVTHAREYLKSKWLSVGSWDGKVRETAWALIALSGKLSFSQGYYNGPVNGSLFDDTGNYEDICDDLEDNDGDGLIDCDDSDCSLADYCSLQDPDKDLNNTYLDVENCYDGLDNDGDGLIDDSDDDCLALGSDEGCVVDSDCFSGEVCIAGLCSFSDLPSDPFVEEEEGGSGWLIFFILLILILGGGGAFFYIKYVKPGKFKFKKTASFDNYKSNRQSFPSSRPSMARPAPVSKPSNVVRPAPYYKSSKISKKDDDALEKSLKKAEELLHGKK